MSVLDICLLCLQQKDDLFKVFGKRGIELSTGSTLKEHFWFEVIESDEKSICEKCWWAVQSFHDFYNSVKFNHQQQLIFDINTFSVEAKEHIEIVELLHTIKDEPSIDIENDIDDCTSDIPDTPHSPTGESCIEAELNCVTDTPTIKRRKRLRISVSPSSKTASKKFKTDCHTILLSTYFNMSCDLCDTLLSSYRDAKNHYNHVHNVNKGYLICCNKKFFRLSLMLQHCHWHMNPDSFKCYRCPKNFDRKDKLRQHVSLCHASEHEKVFSCNDCDDTFSKQYYLNAHMKKWHTSQSLVEVDKKVRKPRNNFNKEHEMLRNRFLMQCDLCGEPYSVFRDAQLHHLKVHDQEGYLNCCDQKFFKMYRAVQHCFWHDDPETLGCSICQKSFTDKINLRDHIRNVHSPEDEREFRCDICKRSFAKSYYLTSHMKVNHVKDEDKQFECHICRKRFVILSCLEKHIKTIHRDVTHICEVCAKPFKSRKAYELHYRNIHTNILQKVQCDICGTWLKHKQRLAIHFVRKHRKQSSTCAICGRVSSDIRAHMKNVHCEASFKCTICGKMFKKQLPLKEHMAIHAGITDLYKCEFCTKTFRSSANMCSHRKRAHPVEVEQKKASQNSFTSAITV